MKERNNPRKADKANKLFELRRALMRYGYRQFSPSRFEGTEGLNVFQVELTAVGVEKRIQRCDFEREPGTNRAWVRPDNVSCPYWWEDYAFGWLKDIVVDPDGRIRGMTRYKNVKRH